jgi:hypothetical protein
MTKRIVGRFGFALGSARLACFHKGGAEVDLTLQFNVLAACAVFLFLGAIILGAF